MSAPYGQRVSGDRLRRVTEYVRAWLFPPEAPELIYAEPAAVAFHPRPALLVALLAREHEAQ